MPVIKKGGILYISCGTPGSGKSTFLNEMKSDNEIVISRDNIRFSLLKPGEDYFAHEKEVYTKFLNEIVRNIRNKVNVYADATHLNEKSRFILLSQLKRRGCYPSEINAIYFNVPLNTCLERNEYRKGTAAYVPPDKLREMFSAFTPPHAYEGFTNIWSVDSEGDVTLVYGQEG